MRRNAGLKRRPAPPNIHDADAAYIKSNLTEWDQKIQRERESLGLVTREDEPLVEISPAYREALDQADYPTEACITPNEVLENGVEGLSVEQREHIGHCGGCYTVINASKLSEQMLEQVVGQCRALIASAEEAQYGVKVERRRVSFRHFERELFSSFSPVMLVLAGYLAIAIQAGHRPSIEALLTVLPYFVLAALVLISVPYVFRKFPSPSVWRSYSGALTGGLAVAFLVWGTLSLNTRKVESQRVVVQSLANDQLQDFALDSMAFYKKEGKYPPIATDAGPVQVTISHQSDGQVSYVATTKSLPGQVTIHLNPTQGTMTLHNDSNKLSSQELARLLLGTIQRDPGDKTSRIVLSDGGKIPIPEQSELSTLPANTQVFVSIDSQDSSVKVLSHGMRVSLAQVSANDKRTRDPN
jgi:hypothetical protein